jgi:serine/threonine protein kinase
MANLETSIGLERYWELVRLLVLKNIGAFGEVRMCVHRESGAQRAVKVLRKSHMDEDEKRMLFNEINILKEIVRNIARSHYYIIGSSKYSQNV